MKKKHMYVVPVIGLLLLSILTFLNVSVVNAANWWDKFGTPQYGGKFTQITGMVFSSFDTTGFPNPNNIWYTLPLFEPDWTLEPETYPTYMGFVPEKYCVGNAAKSWEFTDGQTFVVKLREGIRWQNKPPVNGREFTAYDIEAHFKRAMGPKSFWAGMLRTVESVTAKDKYTVVFKFKIPCSGTGFHLIRDVARSYEAPEWVALEEKERNDWHNVVGPGPWILTDFVEGSSMTYSRNPDYFGHDPRYPENQVPYADTLTTVCITDFSTQLAALRTGKVDRLEQITWQNINVLKSSNPDLVISDPIVAAGTGVGFRLDKKPFDDIRVRKALQMALDSETIAKNFYGGFADTVPTVGAITQAYKGWAFDYKDWPQELRDEFKYNPKRAKELLAEAGYPNGFKTNVIQANSPPFGSPDSVELMQIFKSYWKEIGVDLEIKVMDAVNAENILRAGKHDQMLGGHQGAPFPPIRVIDMYWSKGSDAAIMAMNDPVYDEAHDRFVSSKTEAEAAKAMMDADHRIIEQHYSVAVSSAGTFIAWQPYVKGYDWRKELDNWTKLWIDQSLKKSMGR